MLLGYVATQDSLKAGARLRGKAFECISLLGLSVGKERFAAAAQQTMSAMLATPMAADDIQTDCIRDAMARMSKIMGPDFVPFLPALLPGILSGLSLASVVTVSAGEDDEAQDDDVVVM